MVRVRCGKAGDGGLDRPGAEGEKDSVDWEDHLVDSESLRTDGPGEKDPVEKAEDPGKKSGGGEEKGSVEAEGFCYIYVEIRDGYDGRNR